MMQGRSMAWVPALLLAAAQAAWAAGQVTEAHSGTRKGTVYEATPEAYAPAASAATSSSNAAPSAARDGGAAPAINAADGGSAPSVPGAGVEIISGGASNAGAAKVGQLPVLQ